MSVKLKPITETSWLVIGDTDDIRIGLLSEIRSQYILMVKGERQQFINRKEVNTFFDEDVFQNVVTPTLPVPIKKDYFVKGFLVDCDNPFEVNIKDSTLPLYSKKETSDVYYSAGYYCLNFPKNWMPAYSPKLSTLETYEYAGPFQSEIEMKLTLAKKRKEKTLCQK